MCTKELQEPRLVLRMTKDLHRWFKWYALKNETTMSAILKGHIEKLKRKDEKTQHNAHKETLDAEK